MGRHDFGGEQPLNYEQKCPCFLVLDVSGSMSGDPIQQLNAGLQRFQQDVRADEVASNRLEVGIITFESQVRTVQEPKLIDQFVIPQLETGGSTRLVDGVREAISMVEARKKWYQSTGQAYYRPYIILITDGAPDSDQDTTGLAREIKNGVDGKHFNFWAFGVEGADMEMLKTICHPAASPLKITNYDFKGFFLWLSRSMGEVARSHPGVVLDISPQKLVPENPGIFQHKV